MKRAIRYLKWPCLIYLGVLILLVLMERMLVYPAPPKSDGDWTAATFELEDVQFESIDGTRLHGWFADHPNPKGYLLFCHGNGEHLGYLGSWLSSLRADLDVAIFAFDYRGYGRSEGKPFEQGVLEDGEAAQQWLAQRAAIAPQDVMLFGRSLGGGVVVHLASKLGTQALIAERTFHSMVDIGAEQYPWAPVRWLMRNRYVSEERIESFHGPLLQLHGTTDRLVPLSSARRLFEACPSNDKRFIEVPGMGHNDPAPPEFFDAFRDIIDRTQVTSP